MRQLISNILRGIARYILRVELDTIKNVVLDQEKEIGVLLETKHHYQTEVRTVVSQERFNVVVNTLPAMIVNGTSTELQVASLVGQQATVEALRKALVAG